MSQRPLLRVVVEGPAKSGKTTLAAGLALALRQGGMRNITMHENEPIRLEDTITPEAFTAFCEGTQPRIDFATRIVRDDRAALANPIVMEARRVYSEAYGKAYHRSHGAAHEQGLRAVLNMEAVASGISAISAISAMWHETDAKERAAYLTGSSPAVEAASAAYYDGMTLDGKDATPHNEGWAGKNETFKGRVRTHMERALVAAFVAMGEEPAAMAEKTAADDRARSASRFLADPEVRAKVRENAADMRDLKDATRYRRALQAVRDRIILPAHGGITDTFWMTPTETVVDYINHVLATRSEEPNPTVPGMREAPWGVEDCGHSLYVGPMRPDGIKVSRIVYSAGELQDYRAEYAERIRREARLIVDSVNASLAPQPPKADFASSRSEGMEPKAETLAAVVPRNTATTKELRELFSIEEDEPLALETDPATGGIATHDGLWTPHDTDPNLWEFHKNENDDGYENGPARLARIKAQMLQHGGVDTEDMEWMAQQAQSVVDAEEYSPIPPHDRDEMARVIELFVAEGSDLSEPRALDVLLDALAEAFRR